MSNRYSKLSIAALAGAVAIAAFAAADAGAAAGQATKPASAEQAGETYTWSAELVAFDAASNTITVKAMLVSNPEATDLAALHAGDRATLTWSGLSTAAGVRSLQRGSSSGFDRLTMPVEYVGSELDGRYVSFKVPIPAKDNAAIAKLQPGAYVTATSPLRAKTPAEAVISIKPYGDVS